ncbi:hypothetical protein AVEN_158561-1, partial [Araneus ventricosus]
MNAPLFAFNRVECCRKEEGSYIGTICLENAWVSLFTVERLPCEIQTQLNRHQLSWMFWKCFPWNGIEVLVVTSKTSRT